MLLGGNVSFQEPTVLFDTETFTKIKTFNEPTLNGNYILLVDNDHVALGLHTLDLNTGKLSDEEWYLGNKGIQLRNGIYLYVHENKNEFDPNSKYTVELIIKESKTSNTEIREYSHDVIHELIIQFFEIDNGSFLTIKQNGKVQLWKY